MGQDSGKLNQNRLVSIAKGNLETLSLFMKLVGLGMLIDGTGRDFDKMAREKARAEDLGYDTFMIFVDTSLPVALEREC